MESRAAELRASRSPAGNREDAGLGSAEEDVAHRFPFGVAAADRFAARCMSLTDTCPLRLTIGPQPTQGSIWHQTLLRTGLPLDRETPPNHVYDPRPLRVRRLARPYPYVARCRCHRARAGA